MLQRPGRKSPTDFASHRAALAACSVLTVCALAGCGSGDSSGVSDAGNDTTQPADASLLDASDGAARHVNDGAPDAASDAPDAVATDAADAAEAGPLLYLDAGTACAPDASHGGDRWQDLYACYFGATGVAGCGTMMFCHSNPQDDGTLSSNGFICDPNDAGACWFNMSTLLVTDAGPSDPTATTLYTALRKSDGTGSMPQLPTNLVFQTGDMSRIRAWITAGAPNN